MKTKREKIQVDAKRWAAYAAAGAAATLGGTATADADITLVEPNVVLFDPAPNDGNTDIVYAQTFGGPGAALYFAHHYKSSPLYGIAAMIIHRSNSSAAMSVAGSMRPGDYNYPSNLPYGQNISTLSAFINAGAPTIQPGDGRFGTLAWASGGGYSQFVDTGGYIAFRFDIGSGTQYGWAKFGLETGNPVNVLRLEQIAWADAGQSLFVGEVDAIPEPASLSCLALGAVGLLSWRRRRNLAN